MSKTGDSVDNVRATTTADAYGLRNMIRRMSIRLTRAVRWSTSGVKQLDSRTPETRQAEPFLNSGFYSRPPNNANAEAIVVFLGGDAENPAIVATRDEDTRKKAAGNLQPDETAIFNSQVIATMRAGQLIELRRVQPQQSLEFALKAQTYLVSEQTFLDALNVFIAAASGLPGMSGAATTMQAAITTFKGAFTSFLSSVVIHE